MSVQTRIVFFQNIRNVLENEPINKLATNLTVYSETISMRTFIAVILWAILLVLCWPLALVMVFIFPIFWLILLPFKIVGLSIDLLFKFVGAVIMFPFRLLGVR